MKHARFQRPALILVLLGAGLTLGACTSYYRVTDPTTNREYYTTKVKHSRDVVRFDDRASDSEVTIQNAEVKKISKSEFKEHIR